MDVLSSDVLRKVALELSPRDLLSLCLTNKKFNEKVCKSKAFWQNKILIDYPRQTYNPVLFQENSKNLYMILSMNSKIVHLYSRRLKKFDDYDTDDENTFQDMADAITTYEINPNFIYQNNLKRGDVIHLDWIPEIRNNGKFLWDGEKVVTLDYSLNHYGTVPSEFAFPEFRPDYFFESIFDNNIVRLTPEKIQEAIENFNLETQTSYITDRYNKYEIILDYPVNYIKFKRIFIIQDYLQYSVKKGHFILNIDIDISYLNETQDILTFPPEWKESILNIELPVNYEWRENVLYVTHKYK